MLTHKGTQTLTTQRLVLRRFRIEDAKAMFENWANNPQVTKYLTWPTHECVEDSRNVVESWVNDYGKQDFYLWAITLQDDVPIGSISVVECDDRIGKMEIGYCIGAKWWHQGITSEALAAVMKFLFEQVSARRIQASHDSKNPNSGAVMKKCGMTYEGTLRQYGWNNQGICDVCIYAAVSNV